MGRGSHECRRAIGMALATGFLRRLRGEGPCLKGTALIRSIQEPEGPCSLRRKGVGTKSLKSTGNWRCMMPKSELDYIVSSGNVFADLGLPNPEEALAKAELAQKIIVLIREKGLTQVQAAKVLGVDQLKVSALLRGHLTGFSLERLMRFLLRLGQDIKITVQVSPRSRERTRVFVA